MFQIKIRFPSSIKHILRKYLTLRTHTKDKYGPRQANLVLIAYASSEGSGEPAHARSHARTFATRSYKQWVKRNLQTENQIPGPSEWLDMCSWNLSWRNARRHKFAWRGSYDVKDKLNVPDRAPVYWDIILVISEGNVSLKLIDLSWNKIGRIGGVKLCDCLKVTWNFIRIYKNVLIESYSKVEDMLTHITHPC